MHRNVSSRHREGVILAVTTARFAATAGPVLVLHDTTEFSFTRDTPDGVGQQSFVKGRHVTHTACGLLLHSSLVLTRGGVPLGLAAVQFWTRKAFKGTNGLRGKVNATRIPIEQKESVRWRTTPVEPAHRPAGRRLARGGREAELVCVAVEAGVGVQPAQAPARQRLGRAVRRFPGAGGLPCGC